MMKRLMVVFSLIFIFACNPSMSLREESSDVQQMGLVANDQLLALQSYWSEPGADNLSTSSYYRQLNLDESYLHQGIEGIVLSGQKVGTKPLKLFWNEDRKDYFLTGTIEGERDAQEAGYEFMGVEGFVYIKKKPYTVPLKLFWNPFRQDNFTTATEQGEKDALAAGYIFIREEGFIFPYSDDSIENDINRYLAVIEADTSIRGSNSVLVPIFMHSLERYFNGTTANNDYEIEIANILDGYPQTHEFFKELIEKYETIPLESKLKKYDSKIVKMTSLAESSIDFSIVKERLFELGSPLEQVVISPIDNEINPPTILTAKNISVYRGPDEPGPRIKYQIELNWQDNSSDEDGFIIYRQWMKSGRELSDQKWKNVGKVGATKTNFIDMNLQPESDNDQFCYKVVSFKKSLFFAAGQEPLLIESTPSNVICSYVDPDRNVFSVDSDGDGLPDPFDKCPYVRGSGRLSVSGCPDLDGDGVADYKDNCPGEFLEGGGPAGPAGTRMGPYLPPLGCPIKYNLRWTKMKALNNSSNVDFRPYAYYNEGGRAKDLGEGEEPYLIFSWINGFNYGASRKGMEKWCCGEKVDVKKGSDYEPDQDEDAYKKYKIVSDTEIINQGGLQIFPESGLPGNSYAPIDPVNGLFLAITLMEKDDKLLIPQGKEDDVKSVVMGISEKILSTFGTCVSSGGVGCVKAIASYFGEIIKGIFSIFKSDPPPLELEDPDDYMGTDVWHIDRIEAARLTQTNGVYNFKIPSLPTAYWFLYRPGKPESTRHPSTMVTELCFCLTREGIPEEKIKELCSPDKAKIIDSWPMFRSTVESPDEVWIKTKYNVN